MEKLFYSEMKQDAEFCAKLANFWQFEGSIPEIDLCLIVSNLTKDESTTSS